MRLPRIDHTLTRLTLCSLLIGAVVQTSAAQDDYPRREAVECYPRGGTPNFRAKLDAGKSVKIAYLGGSITAAPGWRVQSRQWFAAQYPKAIVEEIHAAIGGTGSDLGVFRLQNDVLRHKPDLLFVEFAVNDGGASPEQIHKAMEGIVRQTWQADPTIDIWFVYTLHEKMLPDLQAGKMPRAASAMEELADLYQIPSIHFGVKVAELVDSGELIFKAPKPENIVTAKPAVFSSDGVHPHVETGHRIYTETIARSWPVIRDAATKTGPHVVPKPLRDDNWEQARQVAITPDMLRGEWQKLDADHRLANRFKKNMPELYLATSPDAALEFSFEGTAAAVFDLLGPDGGQLRVEFDDGEPAARNRIDAYCTYHRMSKLAITQGAPQGRHHVRISLMPEKLDKRNILFEKNRAFFDEHPKAYESHTWYAGSLLIIGQVVPGENSR